MGSRTAQNVIALIVIIAALLILFFQDQIWEHWTEISRTDDRPVIAEIVSVNNNVRYRLPESLTYRKAKNSMGLRAKDTVSTDSESSAVINFKSGLKVELEPNSLITIEDYGSGQGQLELTFLRGSVRVLSETPAGIKLPPTALKKEQVRRQDKEPELKLDLSMLNLTNPVRMATPPPQAIAALPKVDLEEKREAKKAPTPKKIIVKESLPESYIASVIRNQRTFLSRCYAQYLRLNPDARGRIDCSLTIEPDGSISTARVLASTIPDPALQQCVVSTLMRARFKSFNGDPIIISYPINFE